MGIKMLAQFWKLSKNIFHYCTYCSTLYINFRFPISERLKI